jgi:putative NIF3 family GTP cyclohydrolase 1 type 2
MSFEKFYNFICEKFKLKSPNIVKTREYIQSASIVTGSGSSFLKFASDTLLTGDIKYHEAMEAKELGINLIDIGHFESEIIFSEILAKEFEKFKSLKKSQLKVIISNSNNPFSRGI